MDTINNRYADALRRIFEDSPRGKRAALRNEIANLAVAYIRMPDDDTDGLILSHTALADKVAELRRLEEKYPELKELT